MRGALSRASTILASLLCTGGTIPLVATIRRAIVSSAANTVYVWTHTYIRDVCVGLYADYNITSATSLGLVSS